MKTLIAAALAAFLIPAAVPAVANAEFPDKPVTVVFPNGAGGNFYQIALAISNEMAKNMPVPITVNAMPGAATANGTRFVADQRPNGYTLEFIHEGVMQASLLGMLGFDVMEKMEPLASVVTTYPGLYTLGSSPFNNLDELVDYAKAHPGDVKMAINTGSSAHVSMLSVASALGIEDDVRLVHTPGGGAGFTSGLLAGDVNLIQQNPSQLVDMVKTGAVKAIAFTGKERDPLLPDTPTMAEQGFNTPNAVTSTGYFWIRRDTPDAIKDYWREQIAKVMTDPAAVARMEDILHLKLTYVAAPEVDEAAQAAFDERKGYLTQLGLLPN